MPEGTKVRLPALASVTNWAPMIVAIIVLAMSLAFFGCNSEAQRTRPVADGTGWRQITPTNFRDGDCINLTLAEGSSIETVVIVPCAGTWQYQALNSFDVADADRYPGTNFFGQQAFESCDRRFSSINFPNLESWNLGDRTIYCFRTSFGLSVMDPGKLDRLVNGYSLSFGECFNGAPETQGVAVELVDCSGEWEFRVLNSFDVADADRYPGENFFGQQAFESCDRRFSYILGPDPGSWNRGNRTTKCVQQSFGWSVIDPDKLDRLVNVTSLSSGECFNKAPETQGVSVELVDCSGEWRFRVLKSFDVADADRYPGENFFRRLRNESCDLDNSNLMFPPAELWGSGYRTAHCLQEN